MNMKVKNKIILTCVTILGLQCVANAGSLYSENYSPEIVVKYLNEQSTELEKLRGEMVSLRSEVSKLKQENLQLTSHLKEVISAVNASFQMFQVNLAKTGLILYFSLL
jgi:dynactin complex subunit